MKNRINKEKIDEYFKSLLNGTTSTIKRKNLGIIYNILIEQYNNSTNDLSIAHIGRLSKEQGGPIAQAIRNIQGKDYRNLIKYFEDNVKISNPNNNKLKNYNLSDYIEDPALKAHINIILAENKSFKNQLHILKENMSKNYELSYGEKEEQQEIRIKDKLLSSERESINKFLTNLENNNIPLKLTMNESIKDENDSLIANPGFYCALKKIME
jgi:hypothetical protein